MPGSTPLKRAPKQTCETMGTGSEMTVQNAPINIPSQLGSCRHLFPVLLTAVLLRGYQAEVYLEFETVPWKNSLESA